MGIGEVLAEAVPAKEAKIDVDGRPVELLSQSDLPEWFRDQAQDLDPDIDELVVPVKWLHLTTPADAVMEPGLFSSQVTVCRLRDERTVRVVSDHFGEEALTSSHGSELK